MRILTLTHELPPLGGGGGRIAQELAKRMAQRGHEVEILTSSGPGLPALETIGDLVVRRLPSRRQHVAHSTSLEKLSYVAAARRHLARSEQQYDLIHAHFILPAGLIARYGHPTLPYLITCHGSDVPGHNPYESGREHALMRPLWQQVVARAGAVVSPSQNLEHLIRQAAPRIGQTLRRIPNGYATGTFRPTRGDPRILMLSRLIPLKGFQYFLQGLEGIKLDYEVNIVGDGPMRPELEELARRTPTEVVFHGWLDHDDPRLRDLFESCSLFVFPSEAENFPTVLLEAMDAGMAIVTTDVKGCPEVVDEAGVCVPPRSSEALREAVQELISDEARRHQLGQTARQRLQANFDWNTIVDQYAALYEAVAHGR